MVASTFNARNAAAYERTMGRWSRVLAEQFTSFAGLAAGERVLDVGCGTGSLLAHLASLPEAPAVSGIDASPVYVKAARAKLGAAAVSVAEGDACDLAFADASFDRVMTQLVLQFVPDQTRAAREMQRVVRPGGVVAAAVWASAGGMVAQRMFLDTAALLDPAAVALRAHTFSRPLTRPGELAALWREIGLSDVTECALTIWMHHPSFADYWDPIAAGEGTLGRYVSALGEAERVRLQTHLRAAYESGEPDGPRSFAATAYACRGVRPG